MSTKTATEIFLSALDAHISARIDEGTLQFVRMHDRAREAALTTATERSDQTRSELAAAVTTLTRDARRPGI